LDAALEISLGLQGSELVDGLKSRFQGISVISLHIFVEEVRILAEVSGVFSLLIEDGKELISRPLNAMVNQVRETLKCAHGDFSTSLRKRGLAVSHGLTRYDCLIGSYDSEGSRLNNDFVEPVGLGVDVPPGFVVIHSQDDEVLGLPEVVIKDVLGPSPD